MKNFEVGYSYKIEEYGVVTLVGADDGEVDELAREYVRDTFPEVSDIEIDYIKEIKI